MSLRLRVGIVGTGIIAQVMHLHFLRELSDRFEIAAVCDISLESAQRCAVAYDVAQVFTDWHEMLKADLDAVFVLTSGSHAPIAIEAARAGLHVFVEKPMCFSAEEGQEMVAAANAANRILMVGYPKRFDPAFLRFRELVTSLEDPRILRVTTFESPFQPYVRHYPLTAPGSVSPDVLAGLRADSAARLAKAIRTDDPFYVNQYQAVLLDTLVHEVNTVRGVLGEPTSLDFVDMREGSLTVMLSFERMPVAIHWLDLPGMTRYLMEFAAIDPKERVTLSFPSPFLRNAPTLVTVEGGDVGDIGSYSREEVVSYESAFRRELEAFHAAIKQGTPFETNGTDGARDVALCQAIITGAREQRRIDNPTAL